MAEPLDYTQELPFFGQTWPLRRDQVNDFATASEADMITADLELLLGIECTGPRAVGELPWRPELGSLVYMVRHRNLYDAATVEFIRTYVVDAVARWYPVVRITKVEIQPEKDQEGVISRMTCRIHWEKRAQGSRQVSATGVAAVPVSGGP